jgi:hypothetical protein
VALARRAGKHEQRRIARLAELDRRLLLAVRAAAGGLDEDGAADAAKFAAFPGKLSAGREILPIGKAKSVLEIAGRVAAVVRGADRRLVGIRLLRNQVAAAQLDAIDAGLARRLVHQPFDEISDVRPAGAAVGGDRRGVGENEAVTAVQRGDAIDVDGVRRRVDRVDDRARLREIRAGIADPVEPQREEAAVAVEGEVAGELRGAAVVVADDGLEARADPLHRAAQRLRRVH